MTIVNAVSTEMFTYDLQENPCSPVLGKHHFDLYRTVNGKRYISIGFSFEELLQFEEEIARIKTIMQQRAIDEKKATGRDRDIIYYY